MQNAGITASGLAMTVELEAVASITMADGTVIQSNGGALRVKAGGDITVGQLDARVASDRSGPSLAIQATWGAVSLVSTGGSILDNASESVSGNADVYASELRLSAAATAGGIGQSGNHLESEVARVSAQTGTGGLYLTEATALAVGQTAAVTVNRVRTDGTVTGSAQVDAAQANLASAGNLVLVTTNGSLATLAVGGAITAAGNLLLSAGGASSDLTLGAAVLNTAGHTSLSAAGSIVQNAGITASGAAGTIELIAESAITMGAGAVIGSNNGAILLNAAGGDITVETINAGSAGVALTASGSIVDRDASGDTAVDISAAGLILKAGNGIGSGANHLETSVATLSVSAAAGGAFVTETDGLRIDSLTVAVNRVAGDAGFSTVTATQEDLSATGAGSLVLVTGGNLTVNGGTASGRPAISTVSGNVLLQAASGDLTLNASLKAAGQRDQPGRQRHLEPGRRGRHRHQRQRHAGRAGQRHQHERRRRQHDGSGNIRYVATNAMTLGSLSTSANVSLSAASITDSGSTGSTDIIANELFLAPPAPPAAPVRA